MCNISIDPASVDIQYCSLIIILQNPCESVPELGLCINSYLFLISLFFLHITIFLVYAITCTVL